MSYASSEYTPESRQDVSATKAFYGVFCVPRLVFPQIANLHSYFKLERFDRNGQTNTPNRQQCTQGNEKSEITIRCLEHISGPFALEHGSVGTDGLSVRLPAIGGNDVRSTGKLVSDCSMQNNLYILLFPSFGEGLDQR